MDFVPQVLGNLSFLSESSELVPGVSLGELTFRFPGCNGSFLKLFLILSVTITALEDKYLKLLKVIQSHTDDHGENCN